MICLCHVSHLFPYSETATVGRNSSAVLSESLLWVFNVIFSSFFNLRTGLFLFLVLLPQVQTRLMRTLFLAADGGTRVGHIAVGQTVHFLGALLVFHPLVLASHLSTQVMLVAVNKDTFFCRRLSVQDTDLLKWDHLSLHCWSQVLVLLAQWTPWIIWVTWQQWAVLDQAQVSPRSLPLPLGEVVEEAWATSVLFPLRPRSSTAGRSQRKG